MTTASTTTTTTSTFTARDELGSLLRLALPITIAQLGLVSMGLVDTAILGRVSVDHLAGASMGRAIVFALNSVGIGIAAAVEPLASQALGAGERGRAWSAKRTTLRACALLWLPTALVAVALTYLLGPLGVEPKLSSLAREYVYGNIPGLFAFHAFLAGRNFLQAHGRTRPFLIAAVVANIVNAIVSVVLVGGDAFLAQIGLPAMGLPSLGAFGAGLGTSIASFVLAGIVLFAARKERPSERELGEPVEMRRVLGLGLPVGLQIMAESGVFTLVALIAGALGPRTASAHQIAIGLASFTFMAALGVSSATSVRVGRAIGAGESPRIPGLLGMGLGGAVMMVGALAFALFPHWLAGLFTDDPEVIATGATLLRIASIFQLADGVQTVGAGALRGAGDVRFSFLANVAAYWLVALPLALLLGFGFDLGAEGFWWGLTAGVLTIAFLLPSRFLRIAKTRIARV